MILEKHLSFLRHLPLHTHDIAPLKELFRHMSHFRFGKHIEIG